MKVEVEGLKMEFLLPQPLPWQLPTLKSPSAGTELKGPGEPHLEVEQTDQGGIFRFQANFVGFLHADCTGILKQSGDFSFQADIGMNPKTTEITRVQVPAHQKFARLTTS